MKEKRMVLVSAIKGGLEIPRNPVQEAAPLVHPRWFHAAAKVMHKIACGKSRHFISAATVLHLTKYLNACYNIHYKCFIYTKILYFK